MDPQNPWMQTVQSLVTLTGLQMNGGELKRTEAARLGLLGRRVARAVLLHHLEHARPGHLLAGVAKAQLLEHGLRARLRMSQGHNLQASRQQINNV